MCQSSSHSRAIERERSKFDVSVPAAEDNVTIQNSLAVRVPRSADCGHRENALGTVRGRVEVVGDLFNDIEGNTAGQYWGKQTRPVSTLVPCDRPRYGVTVPGRVSSKSSRFMAD